MDKRELDVPDLLAGLPPYDSLDASALADLAAALRPVAVPDGTSIYGAGDALEGIYIVTDGRVQITAPGSGELLSVLGPGNSFGERGLLRDGHAATNAKAVADTHLLLVPEDRLRRLMADHPAIARFFKRAGRAGPRQPSLAAARVSELMSRDPVSCSRTASIRSVAALMHERGISSVLVTEGQRLSGIVTTRDLTGRVLAAGLSGEVPISAVMTGDPVTLGPDDLGADALGIMLERGIGHLPVVVGGKPVGMLTQTDLTRFQALSSAQIAAAIGASEDVRRIAASVARVPDLLAQLVGGGHRHDTITRLLTDVADATTRRLLALAVAELGPPPVPYLWLACGSQGRQEQTGVSDQDNCLILDDTAGPTHETYFAEFARFVSDGLDACGYYYCPGEMMATNPRWRQPLRVWRSYFAGWIREPDPMAQMLASVMFDLRPIGGERSLFADLHSDTLRAASRSSLFAAHMISNSIKHTPPLGLFRGFATVRSGTHKDTLDLKMNGIVPVVDLARVYALQGRLEPVNTRGRLEAALAAGIVSGPGGRDLIAAYDLIAETRLRHQAARIRAGSAPDNFMPPAGLTDLERSHLRDAFVVVKTMQAAVAHGRAAFG
jgi:CBS domain-containing protein